MTDNATAPASHDATISKSVAPRRAQSSRAPFDSSDTLVETVTGILAQDTTEQQYNDVLAIMRAGCKREVPADRVGQLIERLRDWKYRARLTADLAIIARLPRSSSFARAVLIKLRSEYERELHYPTRTPPTTESPQNRDVLIRDWVEQTVSVASVNSQAKQLARDEAFSDREYAALACLLQEVPPPWETIYLLLSRMAIPVKARSEPQAGLKLESAAFLQQVQGTLSGKGVRKRLGQRLAWIGPMQAMLAARTAEQNDLIEGKQRLSAYIADLKKREQERDKALREAESRIRELEERLAHRQAEAVHTEERLREREDHWRITSTNQRARLVSTLRNQMEHELGEAYLALDRGNPAVDMALRRLQRARAIISDLE